MKERFLKIISSLIVSIALIHILSLYFYFYLDFWWLDILMHFLGGFWVILFFFWLLFFVFIFNKNKKITLIFAIILATIFSLLVSLLWEVFEFKSGVTSMSLNYWPDTISDTFSSLSGGLLASLYFYKKILINNED